MNTPSPAASGQSMEAKIRHLELIQGVISRLASNSFDLKRWAVLISSAILILIARYPRPAMVLVATGLLVVFWLLDARFLSWERLYRKFYDEVRARDLEAIDFSLSLPQRGSNLQEWCRTFWSATLVTFYGGTAVVVTAVYFLLFHINEVSPS